MVDGDTDGERRGRMSGYTSEYISGHLRSPVPFHLSTDVSILHRIIRKLSETEN